MGYFSDSFRALAFTMRSTFRKPVTVHYPAEKRVRAPRYRNSFALLHEADGDEACVGCLQCEKICPSQVITVVAEKKDSPISGKRRGYAKDFTLDLNACIFCELCVQVCPTDAIIMTRHPETPSYSREGLVLTMDKLYANEKSKPPAWGTATLLMEMQDPKRGQAEAPAPDKKSDGQAEKKPAEPKPAEKKDAAPVEKKDAAPVEKKGAAPVEKKDAAPVEKKDAAPVEKKDEPKPVEKKDVAPSEG